MRYLVACLSAFVHGFVESGSDVTASYSDDVGVMLAYDRGRSLGRSFNRNDGVPHER